jgi:hypothetical protein
VISFESDMTLRWACRAGDYLIWSKFQGLFSSRGNEYKTADIWELRDGNFVTITNRRADLPDGFDLHPLEVSDSLVQWMQDRLDDGYNPEAPIDGPNIWKVFAGDRIVWVGPDRAGIESKGDGALGLVSVNENALVYGEPFDFSEGFPTFGVLAQGDISAEGVILCKASMDAVKRLGLPREAAADDQWRIG